MTELFLRAVGTGISAGLLILAVLVLRMLLRKAPRWIYVLLWGIVALRLVWPFHIQSRYSLMPGANIISPGTVPQIRPSDVNVALPAVQTPSASTQIWLFAFAVVWLLGVAVLLIYTAVSYLRLCRKMRTAVLLRDNIYCSENAVSPFVLGIIRPKIYLPFGIVPQELEYVVCHERAHISRRDHWYKLIGFVLLSIYWFHPLVWLAYALFCRDIELACDQRVIKSLDGQQRADYAQALLSCSVARRGFPACPLAFGEIGVKQRIKSVLNYKKPAFWLIVLALIICIVLAVCFLTDPLKQSDSPEINLLLPDNSYVSWQCLYINLLSNYGPSDNSGFRYVFRDDALCLYSLSGDAAVTLSSADRAGAQPAAVFPVSEWRWRVFPYSPEEWRALFVIGDNSPIADIFSMYDNILYQPLDDFHFLLLADGELVMVELKQNGNMGTYVWSIYSLVSQTAMGVAQWDYRPFGRQQTFRFEFDPVFEQITAFCIDGTLNGSTSNQVTLRQGEALDWSPGSPRAEKCELRFTCTHHDGSSYNGTIYITSGGRSVYTASLVGMGLHLSPKLDGEGGVISPYGYGVTEFDLRNAELQISSDNLSNYVFYTNSAQISVSLEQPTHCTLLLKDISQGDQVIRQFELKDGDTKAVFTGLTASRLYRMELSGAQNIPLRVSGN